MLMTHRRQFFAPCPTIGNCRNRAVRRDSSSSDCPAMPPTAVNAYRRGVEFSPRSKATTRSRGKSVTRLSGGRDRRHRFRYWLSRTRLIGQSGVDPHSLTVWYSREARPDPSWLGGISARAARCLHAGHRLVLSISRKRIARWQDSSQRYARSRHASRFEIFR